MTEVKFITEDRMFRTIFLYKTECLQTKRIKALLGMGKERIEVC